MKLYLLLRKTLKPEYDVSNGFVVRAKSPKEARSIAASYRGDEGEETWLNPRKSTCEVLKPGGKTGKILQDFNAG